MDEAVLTGESVPVEKELRSESFSGTLLVRGQGYLEISRTGATSAMGRLVLMIGAIEAEQTPLEKRLEQFGNQIARVILVLSVLIVLGGLWIERLARAGHTLFFAVALAVAAVPEGLPAVFTLTLVLGVERMAKRRAVVRRLSAVEDLGSVTAIATDKTGTLTENRLLFAYPARRVSVIPLSNPALHFAVSLGAGLQARVFLVPSLRVILGLALPNVRTLFWLGISVFLSWLIAEVTSWVIRLKESSPSKAKAD